MHVGVLGPLEVVSGAERVAVGGPKQRLVLGLLAAWRGRVVTVDELIDGLWPEGPQDRPRKTVQVYITRLRRALAPSGDVIRSEAAGYVLEGRTRSDDPRAAGIRLCLDQPLGGDSAYTVFHAAALGPVLDTLGGRGYRAAHLEVGIAAGRLALNAVALGHGASGLTFYDRLVSRYFHTEAAPLLATAVGIPQTRPAPSGTPGHPAELAGYGRVMARLAAGFHRS